MVPGAEMSLGWHLVVIVAGIVSIAILSTAELPLRNAHDRLRERFILGVPWGSAVVVGILFFVYLFVQHGWWHYNRPVIVAYTAVSMFDPTGWLFAGLAHTSPGHLRGNVTTTLVFAPIVEYAWGHYQQRDRYPWEPRWMHRPVVRAVVIFPAAVVSVAIAAALFSWGPVIGFSVAAFALIGAALVHYPIIALGALVARSTVRVVWRTVSDPVVVSETAVRTVRPEWYGTAVQGHLVGLLLGAIIGIGLLRYHGRSVSPARVFLGSLFAGFFLSVWAVWWVLGPEEFVLFRALGVAIVLAIAAVIALAVGVNRPSVPWRQPLGPATGAFGALILVVIGMGAIGVGLNFAVVDNPEQEPALEVEDYKILYGTDVPDGMINVIQLEAFGLTTDVRTSGVIVVSEERNVWRQMVSSTELETRGNARFTVGGLGWSESVTVDRTGWTPVGNDTVYQVQLRTTDSTVLAHQSEPKTAIPVLEQHEIGIAIEDEQFVIVVQSGDVTQTFPMLEEGENVTAGQLTIVRENDTIIASTDGSSVPIADKETYR